MGSFNRLKSPSLPFHARRTLAPWREAGEFVNLNKWLDFQVQKPTCPPDLFREPRFNFCCPQPGTTIVVRFLN